ncbi:DedA family protein [Rhizorhabdus sp.]|jgi:membrane protein DedA with SNARE-associated domain|uniref:DedA family protein n=1 Tax=Rhizorhabdus sp. TaxID=1968843 RepID=UPI001213B13E|nr:DedA family protein [Rhizorhabdus sp.]MBD3760470.1 DedA family protein [Rhizorhabdus sp.]TAK17620.1 MAG: DedA family protein [Rhizorhabdus sp.]
MDIGQLVVAIGPWAIALGAGFEGETAAIAGGVMAHRGLFPIGAAFLATAFGALIADQLFFQLGRRFRDRPFVIHARQKPAFARAVGLIERYPTGFILAYRFIYGFRMVSPVAIGLSSIPLRRFAILNLIACILWAAIFTTIGYLFGPAVDRALTAMAPYKTEILIALPIPGTCLLLWWLWRRARRRRRERLNPPFHAPDIV